MSMLGLDRPAPEQVWAARRGRRMTDALVPNTAEVGMIAADLTKCLDGTLSDEERWEAVARILPYVSRGEDVGFVLGLA